MLTESQLQRIMPNLAAAKLQLYLPPLNAALTAYGVNTLLRTAAFIAQLAHESGEFRWMEEIWGPTAAQSRYEPACDLAARLGNNQPGDGKRFKGRGPIQITGRFNYQKYGDLLGLDLVANPALAATPDAAFATAGLYWKSNGLNELADAQQFLTITRRINGGTNGLADRQMYYERAKAVLQASDFVAGAAPATRGVPSPKPPDTGPLERGFEAIAKAAKAVKATKKPAASKAIAAKPPARKVAARTAAAKPAALKKAPAATVPAKKPARRKTPD